MAGKLTFAQFAERVGVTGSAISKAVRAGRLTADADGLLDPVAAEAQWLHNRRRRRTRRMDHGRPAEPGAVESSGDYWDARTRRETAEAELSELRAAEQRGELVRRDKIVAGFAPKLIALRERLLLLGDRLGATLAAESDPLTCRRILHAEHRQALESFVDEEAAE